ncbi:MAG: 3-phosphoshikimate 1-carboxyvinyltransferase [Ruminococcus sp.]|nr:3-phosphoshikimate 1-carboxyvinyltransferase [Ruminococcus sp.]
MDVRITPSRLSGTVKIPGSKSAAHRAIIAASLAKGTSVLTNVTMSKDIEATMAAMTALGAKFSAEGGCVRVTGSGGGSAGKCTIDCNESGSTLRFIIPIAAALGAEAEFLGRGRLPERPIDIYKRELSHHGIRFTSSEMPYRITGRLTGGTYEVEGNVSSQFITGLLFALPLVKEESKIIMTSHLESRPYVDMTVQALKRAGITVYETADSFTIPGGQSYSPFDCQVEGDYSQAAFFCTANALGCDISVEGLDPDSVQGDRRILQIVRDMSSGSFRQDCSDIPDLVPILAVLAAYGRGESVIYNAQRLRIKESDRLVAVSDMLGRLGGNVTVTEDGLIIRPTGDMTGGEVDSFGDHRIVMAAAIAAVGCSGDVIIRGAQAVEKSYPDFFKDYIDLGGKVNVIDME